MISLIFLIPVFIIAFLIGGVVWYRRRIIATTPEAKTPRIPFRWRYILLPLVILFITCIVSVIFYIQLPAQVGWHFAADGIPDNWINRSAILGITIGTQIILVLIGYGLVVGASRSIVSSQTTEVGPNMLRSLQLMGNLMVLPQIIIGFVMTDIFSYNIYQKHLLPTWLFIIIAIVLATVVFIVFFVMMLKRANVRTDE